MWIAAEASQLPDPDAALNNIRNCHDFTVHRYRDYADCGSGYAIGAAIACLENIHSDWLEQEFRHGVMAFGGGALLSAVALVLVPEGVANIDLEFLAKITDLDGPELQL